KGGVGIQAGEHAVDRGVDDLVRGDWLGGPVGQGRQDVGVLVERRCVFFRTRGELSGESAAGQGRPRDGGQRDQPTGPMRTHEPSSLEFGILARLNAKWSPESSKRRKIPFAGERTCLAPLECPN